MYKAIIVEDEMFVRMGIRMSVEWEKLGVEIAGDAENGQAAWELYEKEHPDIVLTDIKMPVMTGIELIAKIRERDKRTRIVKAQLGNNAGIIGAALLGKRKLRK